jgi:uncharacterized protein YndB with AHSA1/START domain
MPSTSTTDRIERTLLLRAPRANVWRALSDVAFIGELFGANPTEAFAPGQHFRGQLGNPTWEAVIERVVPERLFSWRWHPGEVDPDLDYSREPTTLVTFELEDAPKGTLLTLVESGFDQLSPERRVQTIDLNSQGWDTTLESLTRRAR